ncbi:hypothetical protein [Wielerella bovis]|nr:hypothetical protein [Wielerella bovis]ULJ59922.1 hypothetical protein MIS44_09635 [Wielerella bovis]
MPDLHMMNNQQTMPSENLSGSLKKADTIFNRRSGIDARHISSISIFCRA